MVLALGPQRTRPKARAFGLLTLAAVVFAVCYIDVEIVDDQEVIAADQGDDVPVDPNVPADSFPGKEDGFVRGTDENGKEAYVYDCSKQQDCPPEAQNQVYVIPADNYYTWRNDYYHDGYHGGLTSIMLQALLISHLSRAFAPNYFYSSYHFGAPVGAYYASTAYTSHYGPPRVGAGGQVVHGGSPTTTRTGTPVAQARPVAKATPVAAGRPVAASTAPVATARPVATPARPVARPPTRGWATARTAHRSFRFSCFTAASLVALPNGTSVPIHSVRVGDLVAGWASAASVLSGVGASPMRVAKVQRVAKGYAPLRGLELAPAAGGEGLTLPPFVTTNHPLLSANGTWAAADPSLASAELAQFSAGGAAGPVPRVAKLSKGVQLLLAPAAGAPSRAAQPASLTALLDPVDAVKGAAAEEEEEEEGSRGDGGAVFSLELEAPGLAVYVVNGVLVMD